MSEPEKMYCSACRLQDGQSGHRPPCDGVHFSWMFQCKACDTGMSHYSHRLCKGCWDLKQIEWWERLPVVQWDGEGMVCSDRDGEFFDSIESAIDGLDDDEDIDDLRLVICEPVYARAFSVDDWVSDDAHDDWDGGKEAGEVEQKINELLQGLGVLSYQPGKTRPDTTIEQRYLDEARGPHKFEAVQVSDFYLKLNLPEPTPWCSICGEKPTHERHAVAPIAGELEHDGLDP